MYFHTFSSKAQGLACGIGKNGRSILLGSVSVPVREILNLSFRVLPPVAMPRGVVTQKEKMSSLLLRLHPSSSSTSRRCSEYIFVVIFYGRT